VLSVRFEPPEQAPASRVSASTMNEERRRILAILGVRDTLRGHFAEERASDSESVPAQKFPAAPKTSSRSSGCRRRLPDPFFSDANTQCTGSPRRTSSRLSSRGSPAPTGIRPT
jgi:hypothetical protein